MEECDLAVSKIISYTVYMKGANSMLSKEEVKKFQERLKNDKKFANKWLKEQQKLAEQVKKELFG